jgi:ubiquinone/menaquinone biosynthesis C-methylase UbiE
MARLNAQYNVAAPDSLPVRIAGHMRRRMFERFLATCRPAPDDSVLDIGATGDRSYEHSNYLEAWYPHKARITAVGIDDASFLEAAYPGLRFVRADGRNLPFADGSFDFVHSSAVLEHVGSRAQQARMVAEALRVARRGVFLTTPNRWFPVEFHSVLPLVHWLPQPAFRAILRVLGHDALAKEAHLNLLTRRELTGICRALGVTDYRLDSVSLAGWPTNLILTARRG